MPNKRKQVDIILPVYNGEKYIKDQIDSILAQSYTHWRLIIRDDGSTDETVSIVRDYCNRYSQKVILLEDDKKNLGVVNNVFEILKHANADYYMFCDQDDIWIREKIEVLVKYIQRAERSNRETPILVHTDATVVDKDLRVLNKSFSDLAGFNRENCNLSNLLQFNIVQGATAIFNQRLYDKLSPLFQEKFGKKTYHDWWCALVAASFGKIFYCSKPLMLYRQHGRNLVGVGYFKKKRLFELFQDNGGEIKVTNYCKVNRIICRKFLELYKDDLSKKQIDIIMHYYQRPNDFIEFMKLGLYRDYRLKEIILMFLFGIE